MNTDRPVAAESGAVHRGRTFRQEFAREERLHVIRASVRRLEPTAPPVTFVICSCCRAELQITWSGVHAGPAALGRDLGDPRERWYSWDAGDQRGPRDDAR